MKRVRWVDLAAAVASVPDGAMVAPGGFMLGRAPMALVAGGALRSWVADVLPLRDANRAHDRLEKKEVAGRLVL